MATIGWSDALSVGIPEIDDEHRALLETLNALEKAATSQDQSAVAGYLEVIGKHAIDHFAHEERLMRLNNYPDLSAHKMEHDALTRQVLQFQTDFQSGKVAMTVQLLNFLKDWLENHIKKSDMRYAPCLQKSEPLVAGGRSQT